MEKENFFQRPTGLLGEPANCQVCGQAAVHGEMIQIDTSPDTNTSDNAEKLKHRLRLCHVNTTDVQQHSLFSLASSIVLGGDFNVILSSKDRLQPLFLGVSYL